MGIISVFDIILKKRHGGVTGKNESSNVVNDKTIVKGAVKSDPIIKEVLKRYKNSKATRAFREGEDFQSTIATRITKEQMYKMTEQGLNPIQPIFDSVPKSRTGKPNMKKLPDIFNAELKKLGGYESRKYKRRRME